MGAKTSTITQNSGNDRSSSEENESSLQEFSTLQSMPSGVNIFQHSSRSQSQIPRVLGDSRARARSLSSVPDISTEQDTIVLSDQVDIDQVLDSSHINTTNFEENRVLSAHSLPSHFWSIHGLKCPVCSKFILPDDIECHLVICLTKPRLDYNEDVLSDQKGECVICLEDLQSGDIIARLPCLCIYHKHCIDKWFLVNRSCPEHPGD